MDQETISTLIARLCAGSTKIEHHGGRPLAVVPEGYKLTDLEQFGDIPHRTRREANMSDARSFYEYIERFKDSASVVFVSPSIENIGRNSVIATAIIDYDQADVPGWGQHRVNLLAKPSIAYATLQSLHNKLIAQPDFARIIKELARFATSPQPADMLEISQNLVLSAKGDFMNISDEISGSLNLSYKVKVTAAVNSPTEQRALLVPEFFDFQMPLLEGADAQPIRCEFMYRVPESAEAKLNLGLRIVDKAYIEKDALDAVVAGIRDATQLPVYLGETKHLGASL